MALLQSLARDQGVAVLILSYPRCQDVEFADRISFVYVSYEFARNSPDQILRDSGCATLQDAYTKLLREADTRLEVFEYHRVHGIGRLWNVKAKEPGTEVGSECVTERYLGN